MMAPRGLELVKGTLDVLILKTLSWEPMHGYGVSRWIRQRTEGVLAIEDAALYQALHRLEARKWVLAEWGISENNRRAKYYQLTALGRKQLRSEDAQWRTYANAVFQVWRQNRSRRNMTHSFGWQLLLRVRAAPKEQARRDVDEELAFHLDMRTEELVAAGQARAEARVQAEREFGNVDVARTRLRREATAREREERRTCIR